MHIWFSSLCFPSKSSNCDQTPSRLMSGSDWRYLLRKKLNSICVSAEGATVTHTHKRTNLGPWSHDQMSTGQMSHCSLLTWLRCSAHNWLLHFWSLDGDRIQAIVTSRGLEWVWMGKSRPFSMENLRGQLNFIYGYFIFLGKSKVPATW